MKDKEINQAAFCLRTTCFGPVVVFWSAYKGMPKISRILLSMPEASARRSVTRSFPNSRASSCSEINRLVDQIEAFLNGEDIRFSLDVIRLDLCSAFQEEALRAQHAIPRGRVSTYGLIAKFINNPHGARAVGTALATNPFPLIIPCHRAIRSDGALGGYQGGLEMKQSLLLMEGVTFHNADQVAAGNFFYGDQRSV